MQPISDPAKLVKEGKLKLTPMQYRVELVKKIDG
jgi:hypothetical protein